MKVIAFNGSARKEGNTKLLIDSVLKELNQEGIKTRTISLAKTSLAGCIACYKCFKKQDRKCHGPKDELNGYIDEMLAADGILLGSPTYFADISANLKALIERAGMVSRANSDMFSRKVGAGVIALRRGGGIHAFSSINHFFLISQMIVPGSIYWNLGFGRDPGEVAKDEEGVRTMQTLGKNMAWLLKKINA